jgi:plastocyanin
MRPIPQRDWPWLVRWTAGFVCVAVLAVGLRSGDRETLVIGALLLGANLLLRWRSGLVGTIAAALVGADIAFWLTPALISNLANDEGLHGVVVPAVLAVASLVLVTATVGALLGRRRTPAATSGSGPLLVAGAGLAMVGLATVVGFFGDNAGPQDGDVQVDLQDTAFVPEDLEVPAGTTGFYVSNDDLFWHTFTIEGTDVDVRLASRSNRRIEVDLAPGTYQIVCRIPGHESIGMTGTLEVGGLNLAG